MAGVDPTQITESLKIHHDLESPLDAPEARPGR